VKPDVKSEQSPIEPVKVEVTPEVNVEETPEVNVEEPLAKELLDEKVEEVP